MKPLARHLPSIAALVASVALAGEPGIGPTPARPDPADPVASVAPRPYESFLSAKGGESVDIGSPADHWIEANRTVASFDSMSMTMGGANAGEGRGAGEEQQPSKESAGKDPHAGHAMSTAKTADPHAGHPMPMDSAKKSAAKREAAPFGSRPGRHKDGELAHPAAAQVSPVPETKDPHAGHSLAPASPDPHAAHGDKEKK